jgi:hypothetical protein
VSKLDEIDPKTDEAKAQLAALKAEAQAGQEQAQPVEGESASEPASEPQPAPEPDQPADQPEDVDQLRVEAEALGIQVDRRWGAARLRQEIDAARAQG